MMKKLFLALILISCSSHEVSANWYSNHTQAYDTTPTLQNCTSDGDTTGGSHPTLGEGAVALNNAGSLTPHGTTRMSIASSGNMNCLYWDAASPQNLNIAFTSGWTNTNRTITVEARDQGGSRLKRIRLQQSTNGGAWTDVADWDNLPNPNNTLVSQSWTRTVAGQNGNEFEYRIYAYDYAGSNVLFLSPSSIQVDTVLPTLTDIPNSTPANGSNFLATPAQNISVTVGTNGGAPISEVRGYFENRSSAAGAYVSTPFISLSGNFSHSFDIQNVDLDRETAGGRQYSFKITYIRDAAGNSFALGDNSGVSAGIRNYTYNVYSNTVNTVRTILLNPLTNVSNIADGSLDAVRVNLQDSYGNIVIPASGIGRTISFATNITNNIRLNQYNLSTTGTALFTGIDTGTGAVPLGLNTRSFGNKTSVNGQYDLEYFVFAPTFGASALVPGSATVNNITFSAAGTIGGVTNQTIASSNFSIIARPLFTTTLSGDIRTQGFVEGVTQNGSLTVSKLNTVLTSPNSLYFEFGNYNTGTSFNEVNARYNLFLNTTNNIREGVGASVPVSTSITGLSLPSTIIPVNTAFTTRMLLQSGSVNSVTNSYLTTLIKYQISGKEVIYPQDIIGKSSYHGLSGIANAYQSGIKIIGNTTSQNTQALTTDQFSDDIKIIGKIEKSLLRKDIQENVYEIIRNITPKSSGGTTLSNTDLQGVLWTNSTLRGTPFYGSGAIYFSTGVTLNPATNIEGNKTLIVEGNIYITGDIRDTDNDGMLGIIALSKNGVGGKIYIHPDVTDIHAILYADKSILSYDGTKEFDGSNSTASELNDQLYIKGSVFSENTIGGSRKTPIACPYFVNGTSCTQDTAQKYDMNYLRRYYRYDANNDGTLDTNTGNQSYAGGTVRGSRSAEFQLYPVIIDYDTRVQQNPPLFFGE